MAQAIPTEDCGLKGGHAPIHIMRLAPADVVNDPDIKLQLSRGNYDAVLFYLLFLKWSFIEGGDLPSNVEALAAVVGMRVEVVEKALGVWTECGLILIEDTVAFNPRVRRDVEEELRFRRKQAKHGKQRWTKRLASGKPKGSLCPPSPAPAPTPTTSAVRQTPDATTPQAANALVGTRRVDLETESLRLCREIGALTGEDGETVMARASSYRGTRKLNPASMTDDRLLNTVLDLRAEAAKLKGERVLALEKPERPPPPDPRSLVRDAGDMAMIRAGRLGK